MKFTARIFFVLFLLFNSSAAFSVNQNDIERDANKLFNWLEDVFSELLPPAQTQYIDEWCFRHYPDNEIYTGVVCGDDSTLSQGGVYAVVGSEFYDFGPMAQFASEFKNQSESDGSDSSSPGNGNCVEIPFTALEDATETHLITASSKDGELTSTKVTRYLSITETTTVSKVTFDGFGGLGQSKATQTDTYQIKNNYLWPGGNKAVSTTTTFGVESTNTTSVTYRPPYQASPVNIFCEDQTWTTNSYTEISTNTISTFGFSSDLGSSSEHVPGYKGTVKSISKSVTVPAGTFETVQMDYKINNGFTMTTWISTDIGALVKMKLQGITEGRTVTITTELTDLEL